MTTNQHKILELLALCELRSQWVDELLALARALQDAIRADMRIVDALAAQEQKQGPPS